MLQEYSSEAPPWQRAEAQPQVAQFATLQSLEHLFGKVDFRGEYFRSFIVDHRRQVESAQR